MNFAAFIQELHENGSYRTPEAIRPRVPRRVHAWASLKFNVQNMLNVLTATRQIKKDQYDRSQWQRSSYAVIRIVEKSGGDIGIEGFRNLEALDNEPVVYIGNHMSLLETFLLPSFLLENGLLSYVIKESLARYPVFGGIMTHIESIAVTRDNPRNDLKTVLKEGKTRLSAGRSVVIFPQSTRSTSFVPSQFNTLGAKLAERCGVPVVPVAVKTDFLRNGRFLKDMGPVDPDQPVRFAVGPAIRGESAKVAHRLTVDFITEKMQEWRVPVV